MKPIEAWNNDKLPDIIWAVLPSTTRQELLKLIPFKFDGKNLKDTGAMHHVTLVFAPKIKDIEMIEKWSPENESILIKIEENCWNDKIQALRVRLFNRMHEELTIPGKIFHITVSAAKGVAPKFSNDMLAGPHESEKFEKSVTGVVYYDKF